MKIVLHLILNDDKTKQIWKTPNHDDTYKKDDYHRVIKPIIKADLSKKLKNQFGENFNIEIRGGEIYIVSQIFDKKTGHRTKRRIRTELKAENYFEKVSKFMLFTILNELELSEYGSIVITVNRDKEINTIDYIIELIVSNHNETPDE